MARAVPPGGRWFPRVELRADGELAFQVRPAPAREPTVVAWVADVRRPTPRAAAQGPGPRAARRPAERAAAHGAGEALLSDADDRLIEGAFTSLLWWEGETLCAVPDDAPILLGITRALLLELARDRGTPVAQRRPRPQELADRETWLVSALHGIRVVTRLGERRSAGRWRTPRGRLAAAARRPDGPSRRLSARNQRRPIANERYPSRRERHLRADSLRARLARAYDPTGSEGGNSSNRPLC